MGLGTGRLLGSSAAGAGVLTGRGGVVGNGVVGGVGGGVEVLDSAGLLFISGALPNST